MKRALPSRPLNLGNKKMRRLTRRSPLTPAWRNQDLALYHGTLEKYLPSIIHGIDVKRGRVDLDFGQGFYTTSFERQAISWAWHKSRRELGSKPVVLRFIIQRAILSKLEY